jgi:hypothetical protein
MHPRTLFLFQNFLFLIHQCIALPLEERDEQTKTYWIDPACRAIGEGGFVNGLKEAIWTAGRVAASLNAFDGQLSGPGKAAIRFILRILSLY